MEKGLRTHAFLRLTVGVGPKQIIFLDFVQGSGRRISAQRNISQVLYPIVLPFIAAHQGTVLQQGSSQPHAAKLNQNFISTVMPRHEYGLRYHPIKVCG